MPPDLTPDQPPGPRTSPDCALVALTSATLDPLFRPQARAGVPSAWHGHVPFAQWLVSAIRPAVIVELGTHNGVSYAAFCETVLRERLASRCYAVDSWAGDDHAGHYDETVYAELRDFHDARYGAFSELLRMRFDAARGVIADGSVDLLHIDGFHSYEAVRHDFTSWETKLSPRAVVLFHDTNVLERGFGVARFWAETRDRFASFEFLHGHGLGVLAVGADIPAAVRRLCATPPGGAVAALRDRFAALGRAHMQEVTLREAARQERRMRAEAADRDAAVDGLRRSLDEVLRHRDGLLAEREAEAQRRTAQEEVIDGLRQALEESHTQAARLAAGRLDDQRRLAEQDRGMAEAAAGLSQGEAERHRLQQELDRLRDHLAAARADVRAARQDGREQADRLQAMIEQRGSGIRAWTSSAARRLRPSPGNRAG